MDTKFFFDQVIELVYFRLNLFRAPKSNPHFSIFLADMQLAVLREADQYKRWMPYITESSMLKEIGKFENLVWYNIVIPLIGSR